MPTRRRLLVRSPSSVGTARTLLIAAASLALGCAQYFGGTDAGIDAEPASDTGLADAGIDAEPASDTGLADAGIDAEPAPDTGQCASVCPSGSTCERCGGPGLAQTYVCTTSCATNDDCADPARPVCDHDPFSAHAICRAEGTSCCWGCE